MVVAGDAAGSRGGRNSLWSQRAPGELLPTSVRIDSLDIRSHERLAFESWMESSSNAIGALQNAILDNGEFATALRQRSVQFSNVVAIRKALSGKLIVYLR